jgi:hypothetical protein
VCRSEFSGHPNIIFLPGALFWYLRYIFLKPGQIFWRRTIFSRNPNQFLCRRTFYGGENFVGTRTFFCEANKIIWTSERVFWADAFLWEVQNIFLTLAQIFWRRIIFYGHTNKFLGRGTFFDSEYFQVTRKFFWSRTNVSGLPIDSLGQTRCFFGRAENILLSCTILEGAQNLV